MQREQRAFQTTDRKLTRKGGRWRGTRTNKVAKQHATRAGGLVHALRARQLDLSLLLNDRVTCIVDLDLERRSSSLSYCPRYSRCQWRVVCPAILDLGNRESVKVSAVSLVTSRVVPHDMHGGKRTSYFARTTFPGGVEEQYCGWLTSFAVYFVLTNHHSIDSFLLHIYIRDETG